MKKIIQHIWKYLTSAHYRLWVNHCTQKELIDRQMNVIEDNLRLKTYPLFLVENGEVKSVIKPPL